MTDTKNPRGAAVDLAFQAPDLLRLLRCDKCAADVIHRARLSPAAGTVWRCSQCGETHDMPATFGGPVPTKDAPSARRMTEQERAQFPSDEDWSWLCLPCCRTPGAEYSSQMIDGANRDRHKVCRFCGVTPRPPKDAPAPEPTAMEPLPDAPKLPRRCPHELGSNPERCKGCWRVLARSRGTYAATLRAEVESLKARLRLANKGKENAEAMRDAGELHDSLDLLKVGQMQDEIESLKAQLAVKPTPAPQSPDPWGVLAEKNKAEATIAGLREELEVTKEGPQGASNYRSAKLAEVTKQRDAAIAAKEEAEGDSLNLKAQVEMLAREGASRLQAHDGTITVDGKAMPLFVARAIADLKAIIARAEKAEASRDEWRQRAVNTRTELEAKLRDIPPLLETIRDTQERAQAAEAKLRMTKSLLDAANTSANIAYTKARKAEVKVRSAVERLQIVGPSTRTVVEETLAILTTPPDDPPAEEPPCDRCQHGTFGCDDETGNLGVGCEKFEPYATDPAAPQGVTAGEGWTYYQTRCEHCGWEGSSRDCGAISYGDDADITCPKCLKIMAGDDAPTPDEPAESAEEKDDA